MGEEQPLWLTAVKAYQEPLPFFRCVSQALLLSTAGHLCTGVLHTLVFGQLCEVDVAVTCTLADKDKDDF